MKGESESDPPSEAEGTGVTPEDFEAEFLPNLPALMAVATRLTGSRSGAEDLVQDTLLKAFRSRKQYRAGTNPRAWLLAILRNTFLNGYRRRNLERKVFDGPDADTLAPGWIGASSLRSMRDPHSGGLQQLLEAPLLAAIDELPPEFRMTVLLADIEEMSYREIADTLACPIGTVMSRLHRGRRWLRARLLEHAETLGLITDDAASKPEVDAPSASEKVAEGRDQTIELSRYRQKKGAR